MTDPTPQHSQARGTSSGKWISFLIAKAVLLVGGGYLMGASTHHEAPRPPVITPPAVTIRVPPLPKDLALLAALPEAAPSQPPPADTPPPALPTPAAPPTPPTPPRTGKLLLTVRGGWAEISVDGKPLGRIPPTNELELPQGRHELKLLNPMTQPYRAFITIKAGQTTEHLATFKLKEP